MICSTLLLNSELGGMVVVLLLLAARGMCIKFLVCDPSLRPQLKPQDSLTTPFYRVSHKKKKLNYFNNSPKGYLTLISSAKSKSLSP